MYKTNAKNKNGKFAKGGCTKAATLRWPRQ
jgi:hypothetical protein